MKERIIESIVAFIFGLVITIVSAVTTVNIPIIVLGAILAIIGIGCFIWALADKHKEDKQITALKAEYDLALSKLETELKNKENDISYFNETNAALESTIDTLQKDKDELITELSEAKDKISKLEAKTKEPVKKTDAAEKPTTVAKKQVSKKTTK